MHHSTTLELFSHSSESLLSELATGGHISIMNNVLSSLDLEANITFP